MARWRGSTQHKALPAVSHCIFTSHSVGLKTTRTHRRMEKSWCCGESASSNPENQGWHLKVATYELGPKPPDETTAHLGPRQSKQKEQQVQRSWGRNELGISEGQREISMAGVQGAGGRVEVGRGVRSGSHLFCWQ